jgi:sigma-B regulation protein RsbU (phosphoserine phosphatase)
LNRALPIADNQVMTQSPMDGDMLDMALAAELQAALLPASCPRECPSQRAAARARMSGRMGGDFYDFIHINEDQLAVVIGDCVGHGVRASLLMFKIMGWLRSDLSNRSRPAKVVMGLNRMLLELADRAATVLPCSLMYAVVDIPSGLMLYVSAGHPLPLLLSRAGGSVEHLGPSNLLLGVEDFSPQEGCHTLVAGQRLVAYSDGVIDAAGTGRSRFGLDRLVRLVQESACRTPEQCVEDVLTSVDGFRNGSPQTDDETVVVFDRL